MGASHSQLFRIVWLSTSCAPSRGPERPKGRWTKNTLLLLLRLVLLFMTRRPEAASLGEAQMMRVPASGHRLDIVRRHMSLSSACVGVGRC